MSGSKVNCVLFLAALLLASLCQLTTSFASDSGREHNLIVRYDGTLWAWGYNQVGQLGDGTNSDRTAPTQIGTDSDWQSAASGTTHSLAVKKNGTLWAWGGNGHGQLGNGDGLGTNQNTPQLIGTGWQSVAAGGYHSVAIKKDGSLYAWGENYYGQLGNGEDGTGTEQNTPQLIGTGWQSIAAGKRHTLALKNSGSLFAWGANFYGQLGVGTNGSGTHKNTPQLVGSGWQTVTAGADYSLAVKTNGSLWTWGQNGYGQLGDNSNDDRNLPGQVGTETGWQDIAAGNYHSLAIQKDGSLWTWGRNRDGQLGDGNIGDDFNRNTPLQAGTRKDWQSVEGGMIHSVAIRKNGAVATWGGNFHDQLGNGGGNRNQPVQVAGSGWKKIAAGTYHSLAVKADGSLWAWGYNFDGQLGNGSDGSGADQNSPVRIGSDTDWDTVAAGNGHSVALKTDGSLWTWGLNSYGQLGNGADGSGTDQNSPIRVGSDTNWDTIAAGSWHTLALTTSGHLYAWGRSNYGQLGIGIDGNVSRNTPQYVGSGWHSVAAGSFHSLGVKNTGSLWAWGYNWTGQLGNNNNGSSGNENTPDPIGAATDWDKVAGGTSHSLAVKTDNSLWAWGGNSDGQLGNSFDGPGADRDYPVHIGTATDWNMVAGGSSHSLAVKGTGLWAWGSNYYGQLGNGADGGPDADQNTPLRIGTSTGWVSVSAGNSHSLAVKTNGTLWSWGSNAQGQLGDGTAWSSVPVQVMAGRSPFILYIPAIITGER